MGGITDPRITHYMSGYRDLPAKISRQTGINPQDVKLMLDSLADVMLDELLDKGITAIPRFGVVLLKLRKFVYAKKIRKKISVIMQASPAITKWINLQELGNAKGKIEMKKSELIQKIAELGETSEASVERTFEGLRLLMEKCQEDIRIDGIGIFKYGIMNGRKGFNPINGDPFETEPTPRYTFRMSDTLKRELSSNYLSSKKDSQ